MSIDISSIQTFTDSELLILYRHALATGSFRQMLRTQDGRQLQVADPNTVMTIIDLLEARIQAAADTASDGGGVAVVTFDQPT